MVRMLASEAKVPSLNPSTTFDFFFFKKLIYSKSKNQAMKILATP